MRMTKLVQGATRDDPFAGLQPVEPLRRTRRSERRPGIRHTGSIHQAATLRREPDPVEEPRAPSLNYKRAALRRVGLRVASRYVAMVVTLALFGAAAGGLTL